MEVGGGGRRRGEREEDILVTPRRDEFDSLIVVMLCEGSTFYPN